MRRTASMGATHMKCGYGRYGLSQRSAKARMRRPCSDCTGGTSASSFEDRVDCRPRKTPALATAAPAHDRSLQADDRDIPLFDLHSLVQVATKYNRLPTR